MGDDSDYRYRNRLASSRLFVAAAPSLYQAAVTPSAAGQIFAGVIGGAALACGALQAATGDRCLKDAVNRLRGRPVKQPAVDDEPDVDEPGGGR